MRQQHRHGTLLVDKLCLCLIRSIGRGRTGLSIYGDDPVIFLKEPVMRRGQSFVEYTLLIAIALIGLLVTVNSFLKGSIKDSFTNHFNDTKSRIGGS